MIGPQRFQQARRALGSEVVLTLVGTDELVFNELWRLVDEFEQRYSRFLTTSELSEINRRAGARVEISDEMTAILKQCHHYYRLTEGVFNPLILPRLQQAGYRTSWPNPDGDIATGIDFSGRQVGDFNEVKIGTGWVQIPPDSALDFGGIGKGFLLDKLGDYLESHNIRDYWLSLGGDILCCGHDLEAIGWTVGVAAADDTGGIASSIQTTGERAGIATSGTIKRRGTRDGKAWHHLIDPRTGLPAETSVLTATVVAPSSTEADIWAKYAVIVNAAELPPAFTSGTMIIQRNDGDGIRSVELTR